MDAGARQRLVRHVRAFNTTAAVRGSVEKIQAGWHRAGEELHRALGSEAVRRCAQTARRHWGLLLAGSSELGRRAMKAVGAAPTEASRLWGQASQHVVQPAWDGIRECWRRLVEGASRLAEDAVPVALAAGRGLGRWLGSAAAVSREECTKASLWLTHRWMDAERGARGLGAWGRRAAGHVAGAAGHVAGAAGPLGELHGRWVRATRAAGRLWRQRLVQAGELVAKSKLAKAHVKLIRFYARHPVFRPLKALFAVVSGGKASDRPGADKASAEGEGQASAWWGGGGAAEGSGTTSWKELVHTMSTWSSGSAAKKDEAEATPGKADARTKPGAGAVGTEWLITVQEGLPVDGETRYVVLRHGKGTFLLLSEDSSGWFRHVRAASKKSSIVFPSGLKQNAQHVDAADLVDMLRGKHGEKQLGRVVKAGKVKTIGNWQFHYEGDSVLVTNTMHDTDPNHPKLVLTGKGLLFAGYSKGMVEEDGAERALTRAEADQLHEDYMHVTS